jgi:hypothetical protein
MYIDDVRTSQETHLQASMACYGDSFTFLYVDRHRTWQETHVWTSTACYGDSFMFYVNDVRTIQVTPIGLHGLLRADLYSFI